MAALTTSQGQQHPPSRTPIIFEGGVRTSVMPGVDEAATLNTNKHRQRDPERPTL